MGIIAQMFMIKAIAFNRRARRSSGVKRSYYNRSSNNRMSGF
jgi:hypothetical protein